MNIIIKDRSAILFNTIIYLVSCFIFLHVLTSLTNEVSAFHLSYLKQNILRFKFIIAVLFITIYSIWFLKKYSSYFLLLYVSMISFEGIISIVNDFNKFILFLLFVYVVIAYYFYQIWCSEIDEPYYNPNYTKQNMFDPMLLKIKAKLEYGDEVFSGYLTNWKETGAFLYLDQKIDKLDGEAGLSIILDGTTFSQKAHIISLSTDSRGIGLKFSNTQSENSDNLNWDDFYSVAYEMGLVANDLT